MKNAHTIAASAAVAVLLAMSSAVLADYNPFADEVIDISLNSPDSPTYLPAPGQFINNPDYNDANKALGSPVGGGTFAPDNSSIVSLGGFGGQLVLAFDHDVQDSPANPMGLDAIVFSNTLWVGSSSQLHWTEPATIEIMPELGGNSTPGNDTGEKWYVIPGSDLTDASNFRTENWQRTGGTQPPNAYPGYTGWPDSYDTAAHELSPTYQTINGINGVFVNPNFEDSDPNNDDEEGFWGYAEYTPTLKLGDRDGDNSNTGTGDCSGMAAELFYTTPDDPLAVGITPGSAGGDAFDIAWAVDPETWDSAGLDSFRYIRITCAVDEFIVPLGEISSEIDAAADVRPVGDLDGDGDVDINDYGVFLAAWSSQWGEVNFDPAADIVVDNEVNINDYGQFLWGWNQYYSAGEQGGGMGCPPPPIPEPTSLLLLLAGGTILAGKRMRKMCNSSEDCNRKKEIIDE